MINTYGKATMLAEIEQLLVVQDHDTNLKTLQNELQTLPFERDRLEQLIQDRTSALERVRLHSKETEVHRKKLELDAAARRDQIAKYKTQQFQTRKNEEFQAIGNEIGRLEREITQIEDQEIDLMEQGETAAREIQSAESSFKAEQAQIQQQLGSLKQKGEVLTKALEETKSARQKAAAAVSDQELLGRYERIFHSKGGSAVVSIEHEVCMGCHMKNTTTNAHRAKLAREVVYCEYCGRMLY
jgi:predicted  nucleic acid-binding Zn-ribbon protein